MMLEVANTLTANDIDYLRSASPMVPNSPDVGRTDKAVMSDRAESASCIEKTGATGTERGEYERQRTRESKVSTTCLGHERKMHQWWPVGTELAGSIGVEQFTARVVENPQVKSGRSVLVTSGPAQGRVCITPTRAAIEATEAYRQTDNLGRGGGVTNGWTFWTPATGSQ